MKRNQAPAAKGKEFCPHRGRPCRKQLKFRPLTKTYTKQTDREKLEKTCSLKRDHYFAKIGASVIHLQLSQRKRQPSQKMGQAQILGQYHSNVKVATRGKILTFEEKRKGKRVVWRERQARTRVQGIGSLKGIQPPLMFFRMSSKQKQSQRFKNP